MQARQPPHIGSYLLTGIFVAVLMLPAHSRAQVPNYPPVNGGPATANPSPGNLPGMAGMHGGDSMSELESPTMIHRREDARKLERKKRMVDNANRLLQLTEQLRAELAAREATPEDAKRLDEIARLARAVKDQMRD